MKNHQRVTGLLLMLCLALLTGCASSVPGPKARGSRSSTAPPSATSAKLRGHIFYSKTTTGDVQSFYEADANGQHEIQLTTPGAVCCVLRVSPASGHRLLVMPGGDPGQPVTGGTISSAGTGF